MRTPFLIIALAVVSFGCAPQHESSFKEEAFSTHETLTLPSPEKVIYGQLRTEPIPLPVTTPFDSYPKQRETYVEGFNEAWNFVISGAFLHGDRAFTGPTEQEDSWRAGWKDGSKIASDRWFQELEKWRKEKVSHPNSSP